MARQVLNLALEDGLITNLPAVPKLEIKSNPRPSFTFNEYKDFYRRVFRSGGHPDLQRQFDFRQAEALFEDDYILEQGGPNYAVSIDGDRAVIVALEDDR